jgi:ribosomal protein S4
MSCGARVSPAPVPKARQGVAHGHFVVNGRKVDIPSYLVKPGDVISVRKRQALQALDRSNLEQLPAQPAAWINLEPEHLRATVSSFPSVGRHQSSGRNRPRGRIHLALNDECLMTNDERMTNIK